MVAYKSNKSNPVDFGLETDASLQGWGARFENKRKEVMYT